MNHSQATETLGAYVTGELGSAVSRELERHLGGCERCRNWVETYDFFATALSEMSPAVAVVHPDSEQMARLVVSPGSLDAESRAAIEGHLADCESCREELACGRAAIRRADASVSWRTALNSPRRIALAAGFVVGGLGLALLLWAARGGRPPGDVRWTTPVTQGNVVVEARRTISSEGSYVGSGANVWLRAGEQVAFGNGFSVASDASLVVELGDGSTSDREENPQE